ncbi:hypothetical protein M569_05733, partial [Genlisea aurea]
MGKRKDAANGGHSPSTVFVANLPYSFSNSQMEELFSDVGPIRRCFLVTNKGTTEHRGFGYVQFASVEDANRAIEQKNQFSVGGRKIAVKQAMHRPSLEQRRAKLDKGQSDVSLTKKEKNSSTLVADLTYKASAFQEKDEAKAKTKGTSTYINTPDQAEIPEKQRVAKTVIFGGLLNDGMAEEVHRLAGEFGTICSITYPLPEEELGHHGLTLDGCKPVASSVLYTSVKSASQCVSAIHQKEIHGGVVWARQLGGEGAKTQKWKLIVRNLPFKVQASEIKDMFASAGFVWDVIIPQNPETGGSKGYAFVKFTTKRDAEKAIQSFNGKNLGKRTIAVDWAVAKKIYVAGSSGVATGEEEEKEYSKSGESEDFDMESVEESPKLHNDGDDSSTDASILSEENDDKPQIDFETEQGIAKRVLQNFLSAASNREGSEPDAVIVNDEAMQDKTKLNDKSSIKPIDKLSNLQKAVTDSGAGKNTTEATKGEDELQSTLFISNLPFDITSDEVKQRFSAFGEVQSFIPVLHKVTKRPRGTGFLKFTAVEASNAAFSAANGKADSAIFIKGRQVKVLKAVDRKTANDKSLEKAKKEETDHRNLYLAKEGLILEGTPAADGVSASDMSKRKKLHEDKMAKLRSPNFRISKTRLIVYNIPKTMNEKDLKSLFINAVTSRATKQKPTIHQIKMLKDSKNGTKIRQRGVAFLEFSEHQHALVALRVLNNNPDTFDLEHRPIVEFALDNVLKLKLRKDKIEAQRQQ